MRELVEKKGDARCSSPRSAFMLLSHALQLEQGITSVGNHLKTLLRTLMSKAVPSSIWPCTCSAVATLVSRSKSSL